jgi:hypothetical protein
VRGPVLAPPCIRHLPFAIAGAPHGVLRRVLAPHLGAKFGLPGGFPFFNQPLRGRRALLFGLSMIFRGGISRSLVADWTYNRLSAFVDMEVLHDHSTVALASVTA